MQYQGIGVWLLPWGRPFAYDALFQLLTLRIAFAELILIIITIKIKASPPLGSLLRALDGVLNASAKSVPQQNVEVKGNTRFSSHKQQDGEYIELAKGPEKNRKKMENI